MSTRFIHVRTEDRIGPFNLLSEVSPQGGSTVAYDVVCNADGSPEKIVYAVSMCSDRDNYCKATGRRIAEGRLLSKKGNKVHVLTYQEGLSVCEQVLRDAQDRYDTAGIGGLL